MEKGETRQDLISNIFSYPHLQTPQSFPNSNNDKSNSIVIEQILRLRECDWHVAY